MGVPDRRRHARAGEHVRAQGQAVRAGVLGRQRADRLRARRQRLAVRSRGEDGPGPTRHAGVTNSRAAPPPADRSVRLQTWAGRERSVRLQPADLVEGKRIFTHELRRLPWRRRQGRAHRRRAARQGQGSRCGDSDRDQRPQYQHAAVPQRVHAGTDSRRERLCRRDPGEALVEDRLEPKRRRHEHCDVEDTDGADDGRRAGRATRIR